MEESVHIIEANWSTGEGMWVTPMLVFTYYSDAERECNLINSLLDIDVGRSWSKIEDDLIVARSILESRFPEVDWSNIGCDHFFTIRRMKVR